MDGESGTFLQLKGHDASDLMNGIGGAPMALTETAQMVHDLVDNGAHDTLIHGQVPTYEITVPPGLEVPAKLAHVIRISYGK